MEQKVNLILEQLQLVHSRMVNVDNKLELVKSGLEQVKSRLERIEKQLDQGQTGLANLEEQVDKGFRDVKTEFEYLAHRQMKAEIDIHKLKKLTSS